MYLFMAKSLIAFFIFSPQSLLQRHQQIQEEISSFSDDIDKLKEKSKLMGGANKAKPPENEVSTIVLEF